ncbi:hypothetical protein [Rhodococcus maanshanensis]|uniref:Uncharacterized protein n=1 Tax=Rhodococcus maanshanensis TaxID=183556 RepID=A0A1H7RYG7_9NOCA|nr:hypothetical protein [Rhodococcus maanshanensis]SEL64417.1 hypothetical protein SAMN05444583_11250 [Rhodococcus maanshanensis]
MHERVLTIPDAGERENLATFLAKAIRLDEAVIVRMRQRDEGQLVAFVPTGFDALAARVVSGRISPDDTSAAGDGLLNGLTAAAGADIDPGFSMDSAWRGALPPEAGFAHIDDVPARVLIDLAQQGAALAKEHGSSHGPPASLLAQEVLSVEGAGEVVGVSMRTVFALAAMGFIPHVGSDPMTAAVDLERIDASEMVRVRATRTWLRLDARFGTVFSRRGGEIGLTVRR